MRKRAACAAVFIMLMLQGAVPGVRVGAADLIQKIQPATVVIVVYDESGQAVGQGSGFFFKTQGRVITNFHVLGNAAIARARVHDGREFDIVSIVAEDRADDLVEAVVDSPSGTRYLSPAGEPAKPGDPVMVIGSPMGVEKVVSRGKVLAVEEIPKFGKCIVHSAHSFPGSSGSPLINSRGEVVGIATAAMPGKPDLNLAVPLERFSGLNYKFRQLARLSSRAPARPAGRPERTSAGEVLPEDPRDPAGQVKLGIKYELGRGVPRNCFEALSLYRRAADQGYAEAEYHLGRMYHDGRCTGKNPGEAARWLGKAAESGVAAAQSLYGNLYFNGDGVPMDRVTACMWTILASSRGDREAAKVLRFLSAELTEAELDKARERAENWEQKK